MIKLETNEAITYQIPEFQPWQFKKRKRMNCCVCDKRKKKKKKKKEINK